MGGNPELVRDGENGFLVASGDAGALANKLGRLLQSKDLALAMGLRGRARVEAELFLDRMAEGYAALPSCTST